MRFAFDPLSLACGSAAPRGELKRFDQNFELSANLLHRDLQFPVIVNKGAQVFHRIQLSAVGAIHIKPSPLGKVAQRLLAGSETEEVGELSERKL